MKSRKFIHFSAAVLLVLAVWWFAFTIALAEGDREFLLSVPIFLLLASIGLVFLAWKRSISGMLVLALPIFGLSVLLAVDLWSHHSILLLRTWPFMLGLAAIGILLENRWGIGWRFTNRQALRIILLTLIILLITNYSNLNTLVHTISTLTGSIKLEIPTIAFKNMLLFHPFFSSIWSK